MLNMKKGLAIVLAAATALTLAPVSTLGLQGVVEAQAATTETNQFTVGSSAIALTAGGASVDVDIEASANGEHTITPANLTYKVTNASGSDVTSQFSISLTAGTAGTTTTKAKAKLTISAKRAVVAGAYTVSVTTNNGTKDNATDDKTATQTANVTAYAVPNVTGPEAGSGLVHNNLDVADGQNYKLVDDTAKFKAAWITGDQEYGADELTWVLVKGADAATAPHNQTNDVPTVTTQTKFDGGSFSGRVLSVTDASKVAATSPANANKYSLIGYASVGRENRVVYSGVITLTQKNKTYTDNVSASTAAKTFEATGSESKNVISGDAFSGIRFQTSANNNFVKGSDMNSSAVNASVTGDTDYFEIAKNGDNSTAAVNGDIKSDIDTGDNPLKNFVVRGKAGVTVKKGTYHLAFSVEYTVGSVNLTKVINVTITVGTGPIVTCADGNVVYATTDATKHVAEDPTVYLDLTKNKTYDLASKLTSDTPNTTYSYSLSSSNVSVDEKGIVTAKSVGTAYVTITPKADGVEGNKLTVAFRVNANGFDDLTVVGKDKDTASVLDTKAYANNNVNSEEQLALRQIKYVQVEVNGNETTNITETPVVTSANKATLTYSLDKKPVGSNVEVDPSTGKITIPYAQVKANTSAPALGVYTVKVVSTGTATSAQTISYYYFVVDYPDKAIKNINDAYNVGSCSGNHGHEVAIGFSSKGKYDESDKTVTDVKAVNKDTDSFVGGSLYTNDDTKAFEYDEANGEVYRAYTEGKTMHFLVYNKLQADGSHGNTYKVVTVKSAPAVSNYVTKIVNQTTGKTLYDNTKDSAETAKKLTISKVTTISVTLAHPVAVSGSAVSLKIGMVGNSDSIINQNTYVTAVKNKNNIDVVLYPNSVGTQVISVGPGGHLTSVDRTDIHKDNVLLAVEYAGKSVEPAKVTGLKVANKKGAAVSVSWKSQGANVLYRVYKKVGSGKWVAKNVAGTKTSLKVKKGAKVTVKVKAYTKSAAGETVWGPKATQVTKKTDKK